MRSFRRLAGLSACCGLLLLTSPAHAVPSTLSLQGYFTNASGATQDGDYTLTVSLWTAETGGTQLFTQTFAAVPVVDGLFDVTIGTTAALSADVFTANNAVWMQVRLDAGPGVSASESPLPRRPLTSSPFAFASQFATSASSAITANTATTASGLSCAGGCVSITELDFDPATQAELATALTNVVTNASLTTTLSTYVKTADLTTTLSGYAQTSALNAYVQTTVLNTLLNGYVTSSGLTTALNGYVTSGGLTTALSSYVTTSGLSTALNGYVTTGGLSTALNGYVTTGGLSTALNGYVTSGGLATALSTYARTSDIPTSVDGLTGGTINGEVSATKFIQNGSDLCDESGNCGTNLADLNCQSPNDTPVYDHANSQWRCGIGSASGGQNASDLTCSGCVAVNELSFDPATQAELNTALTGYATTSSLSAYATTSSLSAYATTSSLSAYATTSSLSAYATTSSLSAYATTSSLNTALSSYATTSALNTALSSYATTSALNTALSSYATTSALNTALSSYATTASLSSYALASSVPTSVNGLTGGTITGDVTIAGTTAKLSAKSFSQNGNAVCDASGNCGQTLASLSCATNQIARYNGTAWVCYTPVAGPTPGVICTGPGLALQWDGTDYTCVQVGTTGLSSGRANGYEITDDWNVAWDGIARGAKNWTVANATCVANGARLPTATEIYRNNATTGTGNVADVTAVQNLWTLVQSYSTTPGTSVARYAVAKLSDGATTVLDATATTQFRCVWSDENNPAFAGDNCHGAPDASCQAYGTAWNVDTADRAKLDWTAAQNECAFNNGTLIPLGDVEILVQSGWAPTTVIAAVSQWMWTSDVWFSSTSPNVSLVKWTTNPDPDWVHDGATGGGTNGSWDNPYATAYNFRCIGKRSASLGVLPSPVCNGGCFTPTRRSSRIIADSSNRTALIHAAATETCRGLGGFLPTITEFQDLVRSGWPAGGNVNLWTSEQTDVGTGVATTWGYITGKWNGTGDGSKWWLGFAMSPGANVAGSTATAYRCVWRESLVAAFPQCTANEVQQWNGSAYTCAASTNGNAGTNGNPGGNKTSDQWGADWDQSSRPAATYADAVANCAAAGGARLPTATELYRVSQNNAGSNVLGASFELFNGAEVHWTLNPSPAAAASRVTINTSTGVATTTAETVATVYRCIWAPTKSDAFTGRACHGIPTTGDGPCFTTGRLRMDDYDRAKIPHAAAAWECNYFNGQLPTEEQYQHLIHAGAPNGTSTARVWASDQTYVNATTTTPTNISVNGYTTLQWLGTGTTTHTFPGGTVTSTSGNALPATLLGFRCVYSDTMTR